MGWRSKSEKAKKDHRPSLKDWSRDKLYKTFPTYRDAILNKPNLGYEAFVPFPKLAKKRSYHFSSIGGGGNATCSGVSASANAGGNASESTEHSIENADNDNTRCTIPARIDAKITPPSEFHSKFEAKKVPTVITNIPQGFDVPPPPPLPPTANSNLSSASSSTSSGKNFGHSRSDSKSGSKKSKHKKDKKKSRGKGEQDDYGSIIKEDKAKASSSSTLTSATSTTTTENKTTATTTNMETTVHAWAALTKWSIQSLSTNPTLRERPFKCGEDDDGKSIKLKLKHFHRYLLYNTDDSPLYIFDSSFEDDKVSNVLLEEYRVPTYFRDDLFHLVGEKRRPPYRWFLIGPERSGTCVHIDPLATSAWNTLLVGKKRWVLFPPHVPKSVVKGTKLVRKNEDDEAIHYFTTILPRIKRCAEESDGTGKYESFECYEFTQYENETVFIPNGWWHAVLNLTDTVGVTQNYCSQRNFEEVWVKTRTGRKKMAYKWLKKLDERYPHLADRARELNTRDSFVMKYADPEEKRKDVNVDVNVNASVNVNEQDKERRESKKEDHALERRRHNGGCYHHVHKQTQNNNHANHHHHHQSKSDTEASYNRDAKRSRVERVVSPELA